MRRIFALFIVFVLLTGLVCSANAAPADTQDITGTTTFSGSGYSNFGFLSDKDIAAYKSSSDNASITLSNDQGIGSLYLMFDLEYGEYTITANGKSITAGKHEILHEYVDLLTAFGTAPKSVTLDFANGSVRLSEIYVFSGTDVPDFVQKWSAPLESGADIVLFASHGDDDQLYFAGLLPLYAGAKNCRVQVVYLTDHRNITKGRIHEMINGLWAVGVRAYPVFGRFADFRIDDLEETYDTYEHSYNTSRDDLQGFVVAQIRRFKPLVAVGHDLKGEYGHGMHQVYADLLTKAIDLVSDSAVFPDSAVKYGTWELPKLYLHLYETNAITVDYDQPQAAFDGLSAFQVTQKYGFPCHVSQQWTGFRTWLNGYDGEITKASQIKTYNPSKFGLYHSTVGQDVVKNDFLENITTYAEQERIEQERLEQERLEQERLEQERLEQERLEQERLEQERLEQERQEQARQAQEAKRRKELSAAFVILAVLVCSLILVLVFRSKGRKSKK